MRVGLSAIVTQITGIFHGGVIFVFFVVKKINMHKFVTHTHVRVVLRYVYETSHCHPFL